MSLEFINSAFCGWARYKHLVLIDTLARTRNMHATASLMNLSQPALSKMLKDIESQFGFSLFDRLPRSMPPTDLGLHVVHYARETLANSQQFLEQINRLRDGGHGLIRVGGIFAATACVLPQAIAAIKAKRPLVSVKVFEQSSDHLLSMLEHDKLDVVIGRFTEKRFREFFDFQPLEPEPYSLVVNCSHPLTQLNSIPLTELGNWPWVLYPVGTPIRDRLEHAFRVAGISTPVDCVETISMPMFLQLLQSAPMIAMLPRVMVTGQLARGHLKELRSPLYLSALEYGVITRKGEMLGSACKDFVEILLEGAERRRDERSSSVSW